jgi:hypothetical protein
VRDRKPTNNEFYGLVHRKVKMDLAINFVCDNMFFKALNGKSKVVFAYNMIGRSVKCDFFADKREVYDKSQIL